jgi:hypothetical protein
MEKNKAQLESFDYSGIDSLSHFKGTHPKVMLKRINEKNWTFDFDPAKKKFSVFSRARHWLERKTGIVIGEYRNYKIVQKEC